jgi:hypothetical protein
MKSLELAPRAMPCKECGYLFLDHLAQRVDAMGDLVTKSPAFTEAIQQRDFSSLVDQLDQIVPPRA